MPRFTYVYTRPAYRALVVNQLHQPLSGRQVRVQWADGESVLLTTGPDGAVQLPARRKFLTFELVTMDPPFPLSLLVWARPAHPLTAADSVVRRVHRYAWNSRVLPAFSDTLLLREQ